jgi:Na+-transporting NADH:ubiquinone oxidoreductase subunit F
MVAGGSGMAPMVSILDALARTKSRRTTTFFFGAVSKKDLFYIDEMKRFEKEIPNFTFVPALSNPDPEDDWKGETGLITIPLENHIKKIDASKSQAYLCGSPGMVNACINLISSNGIDRDRIFFDPFA